MKDIKIERKEEITIQLVDIRRAVVDVFDKIGFDVDQIYNNEYIIDKILLSASIVDLDDDELEVWRDLINEPTRDILIDSFWEEYKVYSHDKLTTLINEMKEITKKRR